MAAALALLFAFSAHLAATRVYQVDECYDVMNSRLAARHAEARFLTDPNAFIVALSRLSGTDRSKDLFSKARLAMLALFWLNLVLLAACAGERPASRRGLIALLAAATLAPLWDYGLEIRHDNLVLTGMLLTWYLLRVRPRGKASYFAAGAIAASLQFVAFKAFVYTAPLSAAFLAFPPPEHRSPRRTLLLCWAAGAAAAFAAFRAAYGAWGLWPAYLDDFRLMGAASMSVRRFLPLAALGRFSVEAPLLLVLTGASLLLVLREPRRRAKGAPVWNGCLPEAALFAGACAALLANPTPYAYNLLNLVPFAFLLVARCAPRLEERYRAIFPARRLGWTFLILAQAAPFAAAVCWEAAWNNARQTDVMDMAESLTAPSRDPVLDGVGLVPTRAPAAPRWLLDTLDVGFYTSSDGRRLRDVLARDPAPVFIPNYRTDWLTAEDRAFLARRYVSLSDDLRVLGWILPPGGGGFNVLHPGRYRLSALSDSGLPSLDGASGHCAPAAGLRLDGKRLAPGPAALAAGPHRLGAGPSCRTAVVWVGPTLDRPPLTAWRDHRRLFVDWY